MLGSLIICFKGMRRMMFQLSGFYYSLELRFCSYCGNCESLQVVLNRRSDWLAGNKMQPHSRNHCGH